MTKDISEIPELKISDTFISHNDFMLKVQDMQAFIIFKYENYLSI